MESTEQCFINSWLSVSKLFGGDMPVLKVQRTWAHLQLSHSFWLWGRVILSPTAHGIILRDISQSHLLQKKTQSSKLVHSVKIRLRSPHYLHQSDRDDDPHKTKVNLLDKGRECNCLLQVLKNNSVPDWNDRVKVRGAK